LATKLTPIASGPVTAPASHWPRRRSSIDAPAAPIATQIAASSPESPSAFITVSTGSA
jgi:hypothetical protein